MKDVPKFDNDFLRLIGSGRRLNSVSFYAFSFFLYVHKLFCNPFVIYNFIDIFQKTVTCFVLKNLFN